MYKLTSGVSRDTINEISGIQDNSEEVQNEVESSVVDSHVQNSNYYG